MDCGLPSGASLPLPSAFLGNSFICLETQSCNTMVNFPALNKPDGLKSLDEHLLTRSYITG